MHNYTAQPVLKWLCHENIADCWYLRVLKFLLSASNSCSKYSRLVMKNISNIFHQGILTKIFLGDSLLKVLWHGQGCLGDRCKGSQNYKEIKRKR